MKRLPQRVAFSSNDVPLKQRFHTWGLWPTKRGWEGELIFFFTVYTSGLYISVNGKVRLLHGAWDRGSCCLQH